MHIQHTTIQLEYTYPLHDPYTIEEIIFFDIETTGFSPKTSYVYLIAAVYFKEGSWQLIQWLNEEPGKESQLITVFDTFLQPYKRIIHYNGSGFDVPFLQKKADFYGLKDPFCHKESVDLYKLIQPLKKLFSLESLKLKSIEKYIGLARKDTYTGEELIPIYSSYVGRLTYEKMRKSSNDPSDSIQQSSTPDSKNLSNILLLHNAEDVTNLLPITGMLYFCDTLKDDFLTALHVPTAYQLEESPNNVTIEFEMPFYYPLSINLTYPLKEKGSLKKGLEYLEEMKLSLIFNNNTMLLTIPVYTGTLKYHLFPATDYFYLPIEDTAIHKSVAQYVDKEYRQKAKPANCYIKKQSSFIPVGEDPTITGFKKNYSDRISYIEAGNLDKLSQNETVPIVKSLINYIKDLFRL